MQRLSVAETPNVNDITTQLEKYLQPALLGLAARMMA